MKTAKKPLAYTHVGYKGNVGYVHTSNRLAGHSEVIIGKSHALSGGPDCFTAACGEKVAAEAEDQFGFRCEVTNVCPAVGTDGIGVTCSRCRKLIGSQRYAIQFVTYGRWFTAKGHGKYATKAEAEAAVPALLAAYPGIQTRVRMV